MQVDIKYLRRFHAAATVIWFLLIFPSMLWWEESVPWLVLMSAWANFASHFSAWQGARAEDS
jgi:hypothetical protein